MVSDGAWLGVVGGAWLCFFGEAEAVVPEKWQTKIKTVLGRRKSGAL